MRHIYLYGPPGSGKSTVGQYLAGKLELPFIDLDDEIEKESGTSIMELMAVNENHFRDIESSVLSKAPLREPSVVALGGGALLREKNRRCAEDSGEIVLLTGDMSLLLGNLSRDESKRPLLEGDVQNKLSVLLEKRKEHYLSFPIRIQLARTASNSSTKSPAELAHEIMWTLNVVKVRGAHGKCYDAIVQSGGLKSLGSMMMDRDLRGPVAVIADDHVAELYGNLALESFSTAGFTAHLMTFPAGENSKTIETVSRLWEGMVEAGIDRGSTVVALGGGVTGDLAGFAASTFMRGVRWVGVPTTLLAMVDSSLGGKTGFDLSQGKNLVGTFHDPELVLVDPSLLETLPPREFASGMAEVVKHGLIGDPELFAITWQGLEFCKSQIVELIRRAMMVKIQVVESDPHEQGQRAALNLGHTIGHAVEKASGYKLMHGEAVSIGMVAESFLAEELGIARQGLAQDLIPVLQGMNLPVVIPDGLLNEEIIKAMRVDKKKAAGVIRFALPVDVGKVRVGVEVSDLDGVMKSCSRENVLNHIRQISARESL